MVINWNKKMAPMLIKFIAENGSNNNNKNILVTIQRSINLSLASVCTTLVK
jgi:hypothetical protein